ncbi:hypothetical protein H632_c4561p0 [Helicosporidium sp. ATCC 50920]|nr:hypothetical protein H632_c4561p0 [Helicosporidium sp. ATCC 50920]|eukprot:KDD71688.1 hypothetical protein H632_c4561p0 [Helicosporidium sp. ATCC 50920]
MELGDSARAEAGAGSARSKREERLPVGEKTALLGGGPSGLDPGLDGPEAAPNGRLALDLEDPRAAGPEGGKANSARGALSLSSGARTPLRRQQGRDGGSGGASSSRIAFVTAMLMGVALCFHSVLEGAAMGAQVTISASIHIFIAIVSHKGLAAYALGSSLVDSGAGEQRFWSVILPFAAASPFGIVLGFIISDVARGIGAASISALASGTFLYVAFMEVIPKELRDRGFPGAKLACLFGGFAIMSILAVWA